MNRSLHIVALDNPWPPDYGGAIDMYYKIRALAGEGARINLHLFAYGRNNTGDLKDFVQAIRLYPRRRSPLALMSKLPFIVRTRISQELIRNITQDSAPVIFEGVHTTGISTKLTGIPQFVRVHNVEQKYYAYLALNEPDFFKRLHYKREAEKLKTYEPEIWKKLTSFTLHPNDTKYVSAYGQAVEIPVFHPFKEVRINREKTEKYALFHGNLSVTENQKAAVFLWKKVARPLGVRLVVAGKNPPEFLRTIAKNNPRLGLVANPSKEIMDKLIRNAHLHLIYSDNPSGMKLKLLYALFRGKHVLASQALVADTPLMSLVHSVTNEKDWLEHLRKLWNLEPDIRTMEQVRNEILQMHYNNRINAQKMLKHVF